MLLCYKVVSSHVDEENHQVVSPAQIFIKDKPLLVS